MITSRITPLAEEKGAEEDGAKGVKVVVDPDRLEHSCTSLHLTVLASIAPMTWKGLEEEKEEKEQ